MEYLFFIMRLPKVAAYLDVPNYANHIRNHNHNLNEHLNQTAQQLHSQCMAYIEEKLASLGKITIKKAFVFRKYQTSCILTDLETLNWTVEVGKSLHKNDIDSLLITSLLDEILYRKNLWDWFFHRNIDTVCIISGDKDYLHPEQYLHEKRIKIVRIYPHGSIPDEFTGIVDQIFRLPRYCYKCNGTGDYYNYYNAKKECWTCGGIGIIP
jgi:hypothetical protein